MIRKWQRELWKINFLATRSKESLSCDLYQRNYRMENENILCRKNIEILQKSSLRIARVGRHSLKIFRVHSVVFIGDLNPIGSGPSHMILGILAIDSELSPKWQFTFDIF